MDAYTIKRFFRQYLLPEPARYTVEHEGVRYLDGSDLRRPFSMQLPQRVFVAVVVVVAIVLGYRFLNGTVYELSRQTAMDQQSVEQNLARPASTTVLPSLTTLAGLSDDDALARITEDGAQVYDIGAAKGSDEFEVFRLPADVSATDGAVLYARGISSLSASQATLLLNGSYYLDISRDGGTSALMRYADFASGSVDAAIAAAEQAEGFTPESVTDTGTDDSGNTYAAGSVDANGEAYTWRISAIALSEVYSISGLPEDAVYVGVRLESA